MSVISAPAAERIEDQSVPCTMAIAKTSGNHGTTP